MNLRLLVSYAAVAAISVAVARWGSLPGDEPEAPTASSIGKPPPSANPPPAAQENTPLISVSSVGTVTLRVEQQPLEWVLDEIARQSGWSDVKERAGMPTSPTNASAASADTTTGCAKAAGRPPQLQSIAQGNADQRYDSLLKARSEDIPRLEDTLKRLYQSDESDAVRVLAFGRFLEGRASNIDEMRQALESGLAVPNKAVQAEAQRRLNSLLAGEGFDTSVQ